MIIGSDLEWCKQDGKYVIDVLGLAWDEGRRTTACDRNESTLGQYLDILRKADTVVGQNFIDADCRQLASEGIDVSWLEPKVRDIRLMMHSVNGHLAGTGSYDLRSIVLLLNGRQGTRFPLDFKKYETDLHKTCAMDSAAALWCYPTLDRLVKSHHLEGTVQTLHRVSPIFALMRERGVKLDTRILEAIYKERKRKTEETVEKYHLWEERGKKVIKRVPIWRSNKLLDVCEQNFGFRPADRKRQTWIKLQNNETLTNEAKEFVDAIIDLGKGANDAHWLGKPTESDVEDGSGDETEISFDKVREDGFIFPRYDICGSPDRAIASGPNIQNFPRPADDPRPIKLRSAVVPLDDSHIMLGVDFSSVETITNAIESNDMDRARDALEKRITHEGTAAYINEKFGLSLNRTQGKAINHGFDKGESPYNLARTLFKTERPSRQQVLGCQTIFLGMLDKYPKSAKFRDELWEKARENPLVVQNSFGRRLLCFSRAKYGESGEKFAKHDQAKKYWCSCSECGPRRDRWKYAIAFLGRSAAFDALLRKMELIWYEKRLDEFSLPYLEVHDELDFSVPRDKVEHYAKIAKATFEEPIPELGGISLPASVVWGSSWAEAH
jgi:DNA polymerase I-like protein with 3'-5' exonuclease and polymerase domains